jgi:AP-2 complex subunit sigma-1
MIHFLLLQNRMGKTRLCKWYVPCDDNEKERQKTEVHRLVTSREARFTNVAEYRNCKVVYRRYVGLYFSIVCDVSDNELALYEFIHLLVETLDHFFGSVRELDIVYHFHRVYMIIDEMILGGEIQEVSKPTVTERVRMLNEMQ